MTGGPTADSLPRDAERAVTLSGQAGEYLAIAEETTTATVRWAGDVVTGNGLTRERVLTVIAVVSRAAGRAAGVVSRSGRLDDDAVRDLVRAAEVAARGAAPAPDGRPLLAGPQTGDGGESEPDEPGTGGGNRAGAAIGDLKRMASAIAGELCGRTVSGAAHAERDLYGYAEHRVRTTCLASSTGLRLRHVQPTAVLDLTARSADRRASAWCGGGAENLAGIEVTSLAAQLDERLGWADRRVELPPGRYEVILAPACVADLMLHLYRCAGAADAADGRTAFSGAGRSTRVGERLTGTPLTLRSDPREAGLECAPFVIARSGPDVFTQISAGTESVFDNGLPLSPTTWIGDGVLTALVQTRGSAERTGLALTPKIDNLVLEGAPDAPSLAGMIAGTRRGLLVTSLWYLREVDPAAMQLTGLTRDGVYLVENGEVTGAVNNFRFAESPVAVLARAGEAGRTERTIPREWGDYFTRIAMPALRVSDFTMSAVSRAT